jgi:hypothetical protein
MKQGFRLRFRFKVVWQLHLLILFSIFYLFLSCSPSSRPYNNMGEIAIFPDYNGITLPCNIAPLNFKIKKEASRYYVEFGNEKEGRIISVRSCKGVIRVSLKKWHKLMEECRGGDLYITVFLRSQGKWIKYPAIVNHVANDPVDRFLVYRLIDPGFETWKTMGIYQRCLENFDEKPILTNNLTGGNCMNCHSFCKNNSNTMLFHMRTLHDGTVILRKGKLYKTNTKTDSIISSGVYPAWHPGGRYVAFSVNRIIQTFHSTRQRRVEVIDTLSDIILYDTQNNEEFSCKAISSGDRFETFPAWSPDGKYLYFCSTPAMSYKENEKIKYDLFRIPFDTASCQFGVADTVVNASLLNKSVSFPRVSPDGKFVLFCMADYGTFPIWHHESDLYLKNLMTGEITKPGINSENSESYHSWTSTGRWIIFSSRRDDGLFTRPYLAYFDRSGVAHKPFLLPRKDPEFYDTFLKSYNIPEPVTTEVPLNPRVLFPVINSQPKPARFKRL